MNGATTFSTSLNKNNRFFREIWAVENLITSVLCSTLDS